MNRNRYHVWILLFLGFAITATTHQSAAAQETVPAPDPRPSPMAVAQATFNDGTYVVVRYSSPRKRGRDIFGSLVPYGSVWRLGANEATEMTITQDVVFGGERIPAGTYALFAIPTDDSWTLIVNQNLGQWGAFSYAQDADLKRIEVPVSEADKVHEAFMISLEVNDNKTAADLNMVWDQTQVSVPIQVVN